MQLYTVVDSSGNIKLSGVIANPAWELLNGDRMIPDNQPAFDAEVQTCIRTEPVPTEALVVEYVVAYRPIAELKEIVKGRLKLRRDELEAGGFPYMGTTFDSDPRSVQRINTAVQAAQAAVSLGQPFSVSWTDSTNVDVPMQATDLMGMPVALAVHAENLHTTYRSLKALVDSAVTPEAVLAIVWP